MPSALRSKPHMPPEVQRQPQMDKHSSQNFGLGLSPAAASTVGLALTVLIALAVAYPNLPDVSDLADYRPKLPLRVFSLLRGLAGEFGEERRNLTPIQDIPAGDEGCCFGD